MVVTRYFGGIKLGAGGLVRAYSNSVSEGLTNIGIVKRTLMQIMHTKVDYTWLGKLENELRNSPYVLKEIHYADNVIVDTFVEESQKDAFTAWMTELTNGQADISAGEVTYLEEEI